MKRVLIPLGLALLAGSACRPAADEGPSATALRAAKPPEARAAPVAVATPKDPNAERERLLDGHLPEGEAVHLILGRCAICHSVDYLTQQRLTPAQWDKTVRKMKGFGAPITDDEVPVLASYLSEHFTTDLPPRRSPRVAKPLK